MANISNIFTRIEKLVDLGNKHEFILNILKHDEEINQSESTQRTFDLLKQFLESMFMEIDDLSNEIKSDQTVLISVKNQKLLRTCFQLIVSFGTSQCLIPGLGLCITKRCISTKVLEHINLNDHQKYEILVACTDFFTRSYDVPVLKNILITFHLCDYLACLIQLAFAPLKKPGTYTNFTMTEELYEKLNTDKNKYAKVYENLVTNCFQPLLMKELLVLQNVTDQSSPAFVKRVIAKEMSRRLIAPGGLLSLIRCFIESYDGDTGHDWKKIDMVCKIVATKHGNINEDEYHNNITSQLRQILILNNIQYLTTAITCILNLWEKYPHSQCVNNLKMDITQCFDLDLLSKTNLPGTIILTPAEVERKINILHCTLCVIKFEWDTRILATNLYILYLLGIKCTKAELKTKIKDNILKCLELLDQKQMLEYVNSFLYGKSILPCISVEEYEAGLAIKCVLENNYPKREASLQFIELFNAASNNNVVQKLFTACLQIFVNQTTESKNRSSNEKLFSIEDNIEFLSDKEENQSIILQLLTEISSSPNTITALKTNPMIVIDFVENLLLKNTVDANEECVTISLVLLNTILSNIKKSTEVQQKLYNLVPVLKKITGDESNYNGILCKEILSFILSEYPKQADTAYTKALSDVFDNLLPVRAHGIMELTKLIDSNDPETISKRHYICCLLQEQLKDPDSYIYLAAINGIASLATHCTEDVLVVLCKEFLQISKKQNEIQTNQTENSITELRMKVGDILVRVTKRLGEMAIVHKATLLNTMLCACRDNDPYIRTSALSNLAEIALVLHYKMGTIIYEVLLCIWSIIETDKAVDCRRAAVMVISSLFKGLGKDTLIELKENLLPIYKALNKLYKDENEDSVVRLHSQIALEELNDIVNQFLSSELTMERKFTIGDTKDIVFK